MPNIYWPRIPPALAEMSPNPVWFVEAMTAPVKAKIHGNVGEAIAAATKDQSTPVDRSSAVDRGRSIRTEEPVYSNRGTGLFEADSISSLNLFSSSQKMSPSETVDATKTGESSQRKDVSPIEPPAKAGSGGIDPVELQFEEFWAAFPTGRKQGKGDALDVFRQIVAGKHKKRRRTSAATIIDAVKRYAATKPDPKYTPKPTTWLNDGRWMDDLSDQPKRGSKYDAF
jgi:hypothetical protein